MNGVMGSVKMGKLTTNASIIHTEQLMTHK